MSVSLVCLCAVKLDRWKNRGDCIREISLMEAHRLERDNNKGENKKKFTELDKVDHPHDNWTNLQKLWDTYEWDMENKNMCTINEIGNRRAGFNRSTDDIGWQSLVMLAIYDLEIIGLVKELWGNLAGWHLYIPKRQATHTCYIFESMKHTFKIFIPFM